MAQEKQIVMLFVRELSFVEQYFQSVIEGLCSQYECIILHVSKLDKVNVVDCKYINVDISNFSYVNMRRLLINSNPATLIVTNIRSLQDIYIFAFCKSLNIPITYIEHGLTLSKMNLFKSGNKVHSLLKYVNYSKKILGFVLHEKNRVNWLIEITKAFLKSNYTFFEINNALLYSEASKVVLSRFFNLRHTKIIYSGYPVVKTKKEFISLKNTPVFKQVLYVHQPLIKDNFSLLNDMEEIDLLNTIAAEINALGFIFVFKAHPRDDVGFYKKHLTWTIQLEQDKDIHTLIASSEIVLGHFSTALLSAVLLNKCLIVLEFWKLKVDSTNFFKPLDVSVYSVDQLVEAVKTKKNIKHEVIKSFVKLKIGDQNSDEERCQNLYKLISE